jgi:hypothetical protein
MSRSPFFITLLVCGAALGWLYLHADPPAKEKPRARQKARPAAAPAAPVARAEVPPPIFGYPDPRGILLELRERKADCAGSRFRSQSPAFVLWDDGNVVSMSPTYDYRRSRVSIAQAAAWSREFQSIAAGETRISCEILRERSARGDVMTMKGRLGAGGELTLSGPNLSSVDRAHQNSCADCGLLAGLSRLLLEIDEHRRRPGPTDTLAGMPVEVYLEFRSCGCRDHPEIAKVSKEWPLAGEKPEERTGRRIARFRLEDPREIRVLAEAISRSASVLDRGEIYTCFMRPLMELPKEGALARR